MMRKISLSRGRRQVLIVLLIGLLAWIGVMPPLAVRNGAYELYRAATWQKVRWERRGMEELRAGPVSVFHDGGDRESAQIVAGLFERYRTSVDRNYGVQGRTPVQAVIYASRRSLATSMGWANGESALGVYWGGSIKLLSPSVWLAGRSHEDIERVYEKNGPVVHEYTHLVIDQMTSGNIPRWLTEGLAQVEEQRLTGYLWLEPGSAIREDNLIDLRMMNGKFDDLPNQPLAYHQSYTMARYLVESQGQEMVNQMLRQLGRGYTLDQVLRRVMGVGLAEYEENWRQWVVSEYGIGAS